MNPNFYRLLSNFDGKAFAGVYKVTTGVDAIGRKVAMPTSKQVQIFDKRNVKFYPDFDVKVLCGCRTCKVSI